MTDKKYIDANALKNQIMNMYGYLDEETLDTLVNVLDSQPAADVAPKQPWISVKDRLPGPFLCVLATDGEFVFVAAYQGQQRWSGNDGFGDVTHWMPLPEPPEEVTP